MSNILPISAGLTMVLIGIGVIKNKWASAEAKEKNEKRLVLGGLIIFTVGLIRFILFLQNK
jgi:hypothetical protein